MNLAPPLPEQQAQNKGLFQGLQPPLTPGGPPLPPSQSLDKLAVTEDVDEDHPGVISDLSAFIIQARERESVTLAVNSQPGAARADVVTGADTDYLKQALASLTNEFNVSGCAILSHEGILYFSTFPDQLDAETMAVRSLAVHMGSADISDRLGYPGLRQIVMQTTTGHVVIGHFPVGICLIATEGTTSAQTSMIIERLRSLTG